jgi:hypothetical protein
VRVPSFACLDGDGKTAEFKEEARETLKELKTLPSHGQYIPMHAYRYAKQYCLLYFLHLLMTRLQ